MSVVLRSHADPASEEFAANEAAHAELTADLQRPVRRASARAAASAPPSATSPAASCSPASGSEMLLDRGSPFLELSQLAAHGMYEDQAPGRRDHHRHRPGRGPRGDDRLQRRDGQGRLLLPDDRAQAHPRPGDRAAEPPALHLPRRLRRRLPAAAGRALPRRPRLRPELLQPGEPLRRGHPADRRRARLLHRGRRLRPGDVRRERHRRRTGDDLPRRPAAGESGDRAKRSAPRSSAAASCTRKVSGVADHLAADDREALAIVRSIVATLPERRPDAVAADPGRAARGRPGGPHRRGPAGHPHPVRPARDHRPDRRRQPLPRVQGRLRVDARLRLRPPARPPGRDPRQPGRDLLLQRPEGRPLHRDVRPARRPARLPPEHHRLHGRPRRRGGRDRQGRRQDDRRRRDRAGAEADRDRRRLVRRRQLRHVRPRPTSRASSGCGRTRGSA